ncbi:glycosyltransferase [Burkholderia sp. A1]|uniref:glycosyltransferase n=1 Tax=Burkholderia sp. A1 TaxID=148446 RepID=UPI000468F197|nr:glycosyltransferase [Burkholderia sp. A1]
MRIVQVVESSATGTLSIVSLIANGFVEAGHEVHVIYSIRPDTPDELHGLFDARVRLLHLQMRGGSPISVLRTLRRHLVALDPQVVHLHSSFAGFVGRLASLGRLRHALFLYSPHCIAFMRRDVSALKRHLFVALERLACLRACRYIACSASERDAIETSLRQRAAVVENAVEIVPVRDEPRTPGAFVDVVTAGGVRIQKDPLRFAAIAHALRRELIRFTWIGDGDAALKHRLRDAGVEVTGWLRRDEVLRRLGRADVYLSTSAWEGMPVSVIEAMSAGVAVLATRCSGNVDVIDHGVTGLLHDHLEEAVDSLRVLLGHEGLRRRLGEAARSEARARFTAARFIAQLECLYRGGDLP